MSSSVSARNTDVHYLRGRATTAGHQLSIYPLLLTASEASRRRHVVDKTSSTAANIERHAAASSAVSRPTSPDDHRARRRRPRQLQPGRRASTLPTGVTAVSTWTRSNAADTRPRTVSRSPKPRRTLLNGGSNSGAVTQSVTSYIRH